MNQRISIKFGTGQPLYDLLEADLNFGLNWTSVTYTLPEV
jgi:hypothetical protein